MADYYDKNRYDNYPYNLMQMKGSHNSYDKHEGFTEQVLWHNNGDCGCMNLELDIHHNGVDGDGGDWFVYHKDKSDKRLSGYLGELNSYLEQNPHDPVITLYLDLKDGEYAYQVLRLDSYIQTYISRDRIYTPGEWISGYERNQKGWPLMSELKGKVIVCLTGDGVKGAYIGNRTHERLCFADDSFGTAFLKEYMMGHGQSLSPVQIVSSLFVNIHIFSDDDWESRDDGLESFSHIPAVFRGYVVRSGNEKLWDKAYYSNMNIIATDAVSNYSWAQVDDDGPFYIIEDRPQWDRIHQNV